jgi:hypothetical protein
MAPRRQSEPPKKSVPAAATAIPVSAPSSWTAVSRLRSVFYAILTLLFGVTPMGRPWGHTRRRSSRKSDRSARRRSSSLFPGSVFIPFRSQGVND